MRTDAPESLWQATSQTSEVTPLQGDIEADVAIIGAGMAGITAALLLKEAGQKVVVLEKDHVGQGETGHTTAHLTEILDHRYHELISKFGKRGARLAARSSRAAIDFIENVSTRLAIDCDFERLPAFLYTESERDVSELMRELKASEKVGLMAQMTREVPLPFKTVCGIRYEQQAQFHPLKYLQALAWRIPGDGSQIYTGTYVETIEAGEPCVLRTSYGTVRSKSVIVAADSPLSSPFLIQSKLAPYRTYAIAYRTELAPKLKGLFWDTADPYHYTRSQGDLLIIGGEDHKVGMKENTEEPFRKLQEYTTARFDGSPAEAQSFPHRWSGQVQDPVDGLPYIGSSPAASNVYLCTGFSGNGMTFGTISGILLSDLILGRKNEWAELYRPERIKLLASAREFISENKDYPICMVKDRITAPEAHSVSEVARGEGKIVQQDGKKVAVYRDEDGRVQAVSPVCTHMGCHVHFNSAEKSWDCPCHGSRFKPDGSVLHGPAMKPLKPVEISEQARKKERKRVA